MSLDQFCLKWNNFQKSILNAFESLQLTEDLTDVTLTCDGGSVKAHKFILSACSPYFRNVFKTNPCSHPIVILKDVLLKDLMAILNFMYHGEVVILREQLQNFLHAADILQVTGLQDVYQNNKTTQIASEDSYTHSKRVKYTPKRNVEEQSIENADEQSIMLDNVKTELDDSNSSERSESTSILETALETKDSTSILERSLTAQNIEKTCSYNSIKCPQPVNILDQSMETYDEEVPKVTLMSVNDNQIKEPPDDYTEASNPPAHHSSQSGKCPHCGKVYSNQSSLKYHVRLMHSDLSNVYCCHLCPQTFGFREGYKKHMVDKHGMRNNY